jgi:branched-chain amino acid transport system ATP-binding protein
VANDPRDRESAHLTVEAVAAGYRGAPPVISGISLTVRRGEVLAVLGKNGAGKTTLLRTISGLLAPREGRIRFNEEDLRDRPAHEVARLGIGHVPEGRRVIPSMTVIDNLRLGGYAFRRHELADRLNEVTQMLPMLSAWHKRVAGTLSGGEQQLLSIGRALMGAPEMMLLDEPLTGLAPRARSQVLEVVSDIRRTGRSVVIVEQNVVEALPVADRGLIIDSGRVVMEGAARDLLDDPSIQEKYLGVSLEPQRTDPVSHGRQTN